MVFNHDQKVWTCTKCDYSHRQKTVVFNHIDSKHMDNSYPCNFCGKSSTTQHGLNEHVRRQHSNSQNPVSF